MVSTTQNLGSIQRPANNAAHAFCTARQSFRRSRIFATAEQNSFPSELNDTCPSVGKILPASPILHGKSPRKSWNATSLAFLGDSVWELYVRRRHFYPPTRCVDYYAAVVGHVRAEAQAEAHSKLLNGNLLTEEERNILRWGKNATGTSPKRFKGGPGREIYRSATAIECLVGFLYLTDCTRLHTLMVYLGLEDVSESPS